ncbi:MAG TPA: type 1 glutamine amidotransferase [Phycisphaerae bacterium]|nr:type 1 glutamine amidotransferase [Phycisphaerae bacterium]
MSLSKGTIKVVLIQVRDQRHIAEHERDCFAERLGRDRVELHTLNVTENPNISISDVDPYAAVILGGAGAHTVTEDYDFTAPMTDLVLKLVDADRPIFGSCWGHQFIAKVLGGSVITDIAHEEVGTFNLWLSDAGQRDPLFEGLAKSFFGHMGHHDYVVRLPEQAIELAYSQRCRNQVFRLRDKLVYGTQFHAEMDAARLIERLGFYRESYVPDDDVFETLTSNPVPTPESDQLLRRFVDLIM